MQKNLDLKKTICKKFVLDFAPTSAKNLYQKEEKTNIYNEFVCNCFFCIQKNSTNYFLLNRRVKNQFSLFCFLICFSNKSFWTSAYIILLFSSIFMCVLTTNSSTSKFLTKKTNEDIKIFSQINDFDEFDDVPLKNPFLKNKRKVFQEQVIFFLFQIFKIFSKIISKKKHSQKIKFQKPKKKKTKNVFLERYVSYLEFKFR